MSNSDKSYWHNKGQEHASKGKYERPHGLIGELIGGKNAHKAIDDYNKGQGNTKGQKNGKR